MQEWSRGYEAGLCPVAEQATREMLTLPLFPALGPADVRRVVDALTRATA